MGNPVFRFTLTHATLGTQIISEPDGWKDAKLKMERHPDFHSLVEYFEGSFIFYGENNYDNGGADFIRQCENLFGLDAEIQISIQADIDGNGSYEETIFIGQLDLTGLEEVPDNKIKVPIIRNDFWAKFIARKDTPVNLFSNKDLDDNDIAIIDKIDLNLPSQKIRKEYQSLMELSVPFGPLSTSEYVQIDWDKNIISELDEKYALSKTVNPAIPQAILIAKEAGLYTFDIKVIFTRAQVTGTGGLGDPFVFSWQNLASWLNIYIKRNNGVGLAFNRTDFLSGSTRYSEFTYNGQFQLSEGDTITIYGDPLNTFVSAAPGSELILIGSDPSGSFNNFWLQTFPIAGLSSHLNITADTTYRDTDAQVFFIHDAANAIVDRIVGRVNSVYSLYFGSTVTNGRTYATNGCGWKHVLVQGLQLRGYQITDKQFAMSFTKWWKGASPIFNLSLSYETIASEEVIRIEQINYVYDATSTSLTISNVRLVSREVDISRIFNRVEVGYNRWESEDISGLDDPQTKRVYALIIKKINNALSIESGFIAASLAIEITRRQSIQISKDYKYDNEVFIVAINGDDVSPDRYTPELDENFSSITNLINSSFRYNSFLTPAYNLLRWQPFINGCLQKYLSSKFKFVSGEGNYDMTSHTTNTCDSFNNFGPISESQDIPIVRGYLHLPYLYTIEVINFTWDDYVMVRNNRTKAIRISQTLDNYKRFFIKELTYDVCKGKAKIVAWPYDDAPILVVDTDIPEDEFENPTPEDCGDRVRLLEDGEERITEENECRNLEDGGTKFFYNIAEGQPAEYIYQDSEIPPAATDYFYNVSEI